MGEHLVYKANSTEWLAHIEPAPPTSETLGPLPRPGRFSIRHIPGGGQTLPFKAKAGPPIVPLNQSRHGAEADRTAPGK